MGDIELYARWKVPVKKVTLEKKVTVVAGDSFKLNPEISPSDADNKKVTWKSSNTKIATVSKKGVVKTKKAGKCKITATSNNGKKATCTVVVKANEYKGKKLNDCDVSNYDYGEVYLEVSSVKYKGNKVVAKFVALNNRYFYASKFKWIRITLYHGDDVLATYKFKKVPIKLDPFDKKYMTFTFPSKAVKKKHGQQESLSYFL